MIVLSKLQVDVKQHTQQMGKKLVFCRAGGAPALFKTSLQAHERPAIAHKAHSKDSLAGCSGKPLGCPSDEPNCASYIDQK